MKPFDWILLVIAVLWITREGLIYCNMVSVLGSKLAGRFKFSFAPWAMLLLIVWRVYG